LFVDREADSLDATRARWRSPVRIAALALDAYGDQVLRQPLLSALLDAGNDVTLLMHSRYADLVPYLDARLAVRRYEIDVSAELTDDTVISRLRACVDDIHALRPDLVAGLRYDRTAVDEWLLRSCPFAERVAYFPANRSASLIDDLGLAQEAQPPLSFDVALTRSLSMAERSSETARYEHLFHALTGHRSSLPLPRLREDEDARARALTWVASTPIAGRRYAIVAPAGTSNHSFKRMPTHLAAAAIEAMWREHGLATVLTGIEIERPHLEEVAAAVPGAGGYVATWVGEPGSLPDLLGLVASAEAYVGADLGTMHFAAALDRPVVALFGGGHYPRFQPAARRWAAVTKRLPCFGCEWHCVFDRIRCIDEVSVDTWLTAVRAVLAGGSPGWMMDPSGLDEASARAAEPEVARIRAILDDVESDRFERLVRLEAQDATVRNLQFEIEQIEADRSQRLDALLAADRELARNRETIVRLQSEIEAARRENDRLRTEAQGVVDVPKQQA
jgi:ADP-heptose:LPS heptosyltransferase